MQAGPETIQERLRHLLAGRLPGIEAHRRAWPEHLPDRRHEIEENEYGPAAVLIALHEGERPGRYAFPLIRRPANQVHHGGQISLPGGRCEPGEETAECALREAEEEIGLPRGRVIVLGRLSPVWVPVSRNRIQPFVGWIEGRTSPRRWRPQPEEVEAILSADPELMLSRGLKPVLRTLRDGGEAIVPAWTIPEGEGFAAVWGATAIILSEFLDLWPLVRP